VPTTAAYHLLYEIGKAGNVDIHSNIILLSNEVVREVLSKHDVTEIAGEQRESMVADIKARLTDGLAGILRIEVSAVQINSLDFSPQYKDAINQATLARTKTVAAQRDAERAKVEALTRVTQASPGRGGRPGGARQRPGAGETRRGPGRGRRQSRPRLRRGGGQSRQGQGRGHPAAAANARHRGEVIRPDAAAACRRSRQSSVST
jgi:regulator of protease activity HflC (stomatin/prohibitin superfamily)